MAVLKNTEYFTTNKKVWGNRDMVTVGHNRTLSYAKRGDGRECLIGRLHGHPIFMVTFNDDGTREVVLDNCDYRTVTTRSALKDFMGGMGIWGNVSMASGIMSAHWKDHNQKYTIGEEDENNQITFVC